MHIGYIYRKIQLVYVGMYGYSSSSTSTINSCSIVGLEVSRECHKKKGVFLPIKRHRAPQQQWSFYKDQRMFTNFCILHLLCKQFSTTHTNLSPVLTLSENLRKFQPVPMKTTSRTQLSLDSAHFGYRDNHQKETPFLNYPCELQESHTSERHIAPQQQFWFHRDYNHYTPNILQSIISKRLHPNINISIFQFISANAQN